MTIPFHHGRHTELFIFNTFLWLWRLLYFCNSRQGSAVSQKNNKKKTLIKVNWTAQEAEQDITFRLLWKYLYTLSDLKESTKQSSWCSWFTLTSLSLWYVSEPHLSSLLTNSGNGWIWMSLYLLSQVLLQVLLQVRQSQVLLVGADIANVRHCFFGVL